MRMLLKIKIPHQQFNAAVQDGSIGAKIDRILEASKPEAVYFTEQEGCRGALMIVDVPDAAHIPALAEPWFLIFEADVEFRIANSVQLPPGNPTVGWQQAVRNVLGHERQGRDDFR